MNCRFWKTLIGFVMVLGANAQTANKVVYVDPAGGFESYISAALYKKSVPLTETNDKKSAGLILTSKSVSVQEEKSGLGKLARCAYALCIGIDGQQAVSVELVEPPQVKSYGPTV
jgi:hypothetical protein